jgi:hypothetical protein
LNGFNQPEFTLDNNPRLAAGLVHTAFRSPWCDGSFFIGVNEAIPNGWKINGFVFLSIGQVKTKSLNLPGNSPHVGGSPMAAHSPALKFGQLADQSASLTDGQKRLLEMAAGTWK